MKPVRFSNLKLLGTSPQHYKHRLDTSSETYKRPLSVGTAAHSMVLGGEPVVMFPGKVRNGKAWEEFRAANEGATILIRSEYEAAKGMAKAVESCRAAVELLEGVRETELPTWTLSGRECGGRPDVRNARFITELKTGATSEPRRFQRLAMRMAYPAQLAWYLDGNKATGGTASEAFIVSVEATPPHPVTPMALTSRLLDMGRRTYRLWFEQLLLCESSDEWPGYVQDVIDFDLDDLDEELELSFAEDAA